MRTSYLKNQLRIRCILANRELPKQRSIRLRRRVLLLNTYSLLSSPTKVVEKKFIFFTTNCIQTLKTEKTNHMLEYFYVIDNLELSYKTVLEVFFYFSFIDYTFFANMRKKNNMIESWNELDSLNLFAGRNAKETKN